MIYIYTLKTSSKNYPQKNIPQKNHPQKINLLKDNLVSVFADFIFIYLKTNFSIKRINRNSSISKKKKISYLGNR